MLYKVYVSDIFHGEKYTTVEAKDIHELRYNIRVNRDTLQFKRVRTRSPKLLSNNWIAVDETGICHNFYDRKCRYCTRVSDIWMVHDALWYTHVEYHTDFLCIQCFEQRLGRKLTLNDFTEAPCNSKASIWLERGNSCNT